MAVLAPVLERKINSENEVVAEKKNTFTAANNFTAASSRSSRMTDDESHNARIKYIYEKLINPESTVSDVINNEPVKEQVEEPVIEQKPFWVENARADSDLFRVDSMINSRQAEKNVEVEAPASQEEEENEDLRPSDETIKHKTIASSKTGVKTTVTAKQTSVSRFSKRDKIFMVVALAVIVALFVLVIINSAVLSNLNQEVGVLQNNLVVAEENYQEAMENKEAFWDGIEDTIADFAQQNGMSKM